MKRIALLVVLALSMAACDTGTAAPGVDGAWELTGGTHAGTPIPVVPGWPITMTLDGDSIGGTAACNGYGGTYQSSSDGTFTIGDGLSITEMACMQADVMESERLFMDALIDADRITRTGETLTLEGPDTRLSFRLLTPVPTSELIDTLWVLESLVNLDVVTSARGEHATLALRADGTFSGGTGCRAISGTYVVTGAEVHFTHFTAEGVCPGGLTEQDSQVITALEGGFRVEIDGDLMKTWVSGDEGLIYRAGE